jgi:ADA HAT complex component 1
VDTAPGGMLRLLSWSSGLAADKIASQEVDYLVPQRHRSPTLDLQKPPMLKRKRVGSSEVHLPPAPAKRRMGHMSQVFVPTNLMPTESPPSSLPPASKENAAPSVPGTQTPAKANMEKVETTQEEQVKPRARPDKEALRRTLNSQIGLEILLKHNELRLIDQEIAKCQVALEQLRRCTEIPYPITRPSEAVSQGRGPAVRSSRSAVQHESPAPWGVTDGPYTRHYAKWLLPDPLFDGGEAPARTGPKTPVGKTPTKGRSTRGSFADSSVSAGKSKVQRAGKFQALSSGYPQPKDKSGPMIQKRKSDGLLVKLVCLDCRRDNFSSAQGFINHCRIAHGRNFASHDAAADACGEPVDVDEAGAVVGNEGPPSASMAGLVHPLIYSAHMIKQEPSKNNSHSEPEAEKNAAPNEVYSLPQNDKFLKQKSPSNLTSSPFTPNLSALLQRRGASMDLQSLVADVKSPVPLDDSSDGEVEEDEDINMPEAPAIGRHPHVTGSMQPVRLSDETRKGLSSPRMLHSFTKSSLMPPSQAPPRSIAPAPYVPAAHGDEIEPSPTNDSNQAPSLVDDDGDDEYEAHSPSYSSSGSVDAENRDLDFEIEDGDESGPSTRNRSTDSDYSSTPKQHPTPAPTRRASAFRRSIGAREEKHVSFVSPSPARDPEPSKRGGDRKRRKPSGG